MDGGVGCYLPRSAYRTAALRAITPKEDRLLARGDFHFLWLSDRPDAVEVKGEEQVGLALPNSICIRSLMDEDAWLFDGR
jgi:hypothetical protein